MLFNTATPWLVSLVFLMLGPLADVRGAEAPATEAVAIAGIGFQAEAAASPDAATKIVFANVKTFLQGWTEYNPGTCKTISSGTTSAVTSPKHGDLSYAVLMLPLSGGPCSGTKMPYSVAYYTWTDTAAKVSTDTFTLRWETPDHIYQIDRDWTIRLGPRLFFEGADVTNKTIKVASGDRIALTTQPVVPGQSQSWEIPDKYVGGYTPTPGSFATGKTQPADLRHDTATVYWSDDGTKQVVYTMTVPGKGTGTAKATFEVIGPTGVSAQRALGPTLIDSNNLLTFGDILHGHNIPGISFSRTAGTTGKPGHYLWVQLVDVGKLTYISLTTGRHDCTEGVGLDNVFPYPGKAGDKADDSPAVGLRQTWSSVSRQFAARMFLMWQSNKDGSIPVPVGYFSWGWTSAATRSAATGIWTLTRGVGTSGNFSPTTTFPVWNHVVKNGSPGCT